jgi:DNA-binding NarL/FixJ family response regulator
VKTHISNVFRRIGVADRTSAAIWARDHLPDRSATTPTSQDT